MPQPTPITSPSPYQVQPACHEIMFRDGSTVGLHPVCVLDSQGRAHHDMFLRALAGSPLHWLVIDLRDLAPDLDADMRAHLALDLPGLVYYTLRHRYGRAALFEAAARTSAKAAWHPHPGAAAGTQAAPQQAAA